MTLPRSETNLQANICDPETGENKENDRGDNPAI